MSVDYTAVVGCGCNYKDIIYQTLTEAAQQELLDYFKDNGNMDEQFGKYYDDDLCWSLVPYDELTHALEIFFDEVKHEFLYELGFTTQTGSLWSGSIDKIGIELDVVSWYFLKDEVEKAEIKFKTYINLEPKVFIGVLVS